MLRDRYFNSGQEQKEDFRFFDAQVLTDGEILLMLDKTVPGSPAEKWLPSYHFTICDRAGHRAGQCDLRIGYSEGVYYGGNIGYRVEEPYRGNHYAGKACRLLFHLAFQEDLRIRGRDPAGNRRSAGGQRHAPGRGDTEMHL